MAIPTVKLEGDDISIKMSPSSPSATSDAYMDDADDDPELNFDSISTKLWSTKLPKYLYDALANASDTDEIEIGTIRVEGSLDAPTRISLLLDNPSPTLEREYLLKTPIRAKPKAGAGSFVFSEKDTAGFKRTNIWDQVDEDGNPGQGRSQLYEQALRDEKKKENKGKFVPFARKPIPKITKMEGTVVKEFEVVPVQNREAREKHALRTEILLKRKEMDDIAITNKMNPRAGVQSIMTAAERSEMNKVSLMLVLREWCLVRLRLSLAHELCAGAAAGPCSTDSSSRKDKCVQHMLSRSSKLAPSSIQAFTKHSILYSFKIHVMNNN